MSFTPRKIELPRLPDWRARLIALIERRRATPFEWGVFDCVLFAGEATEAVIGYNAADPFGSPPPWNNALSARRYVENVLPVDHLSKALKAIFHSRVLARARRGDILLFGPGEFQLGWGLAVCDGREAWAPGPEGLVALPTLRALSAYEVGS